MAPANNFTGQSEWKLVTDVYGWYFLQHPQTGTRLRMDTNGVPVNGSGTGSTDDYKWRFVLPAATDNNSPVLAAIPAKTVTEETLLEFVASATDSDLPANTLTYSLVNAPAGASIGSSTGVFTWTPSAAQGPSTYDFTVRVSDEILTHEQTVSVTVNNPDFSTYMSNPAYGIGENDRDFNDDPDSDGMANGLEAFFGTHPGQSSTGLSVPGTNLATHTTTFTHPRNPNLPMNLSIAYEWSPDLTTWYAGNGVTGPAGGARVTITYQTTANTTTVTAVSDAAQQKIFLRAVVSQN